MKQLRALLFAALLLPFLTTAQPAQQPKTHSLLPAGSLRGPLLVRGVSFDSFKAVSALTDTSLKAIALISWELWEIEQWATLETLFNANNLNSGWPPENGATYSKIVTLDSGVRIDRYGGKVADSVFIDNGRFVAPAGEPFGQRSLKEIAKTYPYHVYRILKPITGVNEGKAIPWFGQVGLGLQYQLPYGISDLIKNGYLQEIPGVKQPD